MNSWNDFLILSKRKNYEKIKSKSHNDNYKKYKNTLLQYDQKNKVRLVRVV